jgi:predicted O-linked N-acetylglucosamine transferase (SPINDLY family)
MSTPEPSRNAPCPCGSGRRYKHCCGLAPAPASAAPVERAVPAAAEAFRAAQALHREGRIDEAEAIYRSILLSEPGNASALHFLGVCAHQRGDDEAAASHIGAALAANPREPMAQNNLGLVYRRQGRLEDARACFDRALAAEPGNAVAYNNRGLVEKEMGRLDHALRDFAQATRLRGDFAEAFANLANVLLDQTAYGQSLQACDRALAVNAGIAVAHAMRGRALMEMGRLAEAVASMSRALAIEPGMPYLPGYLLQARLAGCDWASFADDCARIGAAIDRGEKVVVPFTALTLPLTPAQLQRCARLHHGEHRPPAVAPAPVSRVPPADGPFRIAYLSPDFREHPMAQLIAGLIETHDRSAFEVTGVYYGPEADDEWHRRLRNAFDRFHDVRTKSDVEIAALLREQAIDVAVDLCGYTLYERHAIFAQHPAPVQVSYLGFPGTLGASWMDYLIGDAVVIPPQHRAYYDEKIAYMPHSYYVNDATKRIADDAADRAAHGLPADGFVFCCFNSANKLSPDVFEIWMRLLREVPGSVLWLLVGNVIAQDNLRREAQQRGVAGERLVFARRMPLAEHLARHRCADLFVDTFHYNAHTTATDALWAGLPVVTRIGETFPGRVAASLLRAVGLPELVTATSADYEALALMLARAPDRLAAIRRKLAENRLREPLFDTARWTRDVETLYRRMIERHRAGLSPEDLAVVP